MDSSKKVNNNNKKRLRNNYIPMGLCLGIVLGIIFNNMTLFLGFGYFVGVVVTASKNNTL